MEEIELKNEVEYLRGQLKEQEDYYEELLEKKEKEIAKLKKEIVTLKDENVAINSVIDLTMR